jgi:acyl dehydratase
MLVEWAAPVVRMTPSSWIEFDGVEVATWRMDDEICRPSIRLWCEVLEDANPLYHDPEYARTSRHGGIVAPPTMVMAWCTRPEWTPDGPIPSITEGLMASLPDYPNAVGLRSIQRHRRPLGLGERLVVHQYVGLPSPEETTARGPGRRISQYFSLRDDAGEEVVGLEMELLRFRAPTGVPAEVPLPPPAVEPARKGRDVEHGAGDAAPDARRRSLHWSDVNRGDVLAPVALPLTLKRCIKWVGATRDYNEVHHDRDFARATGAADLFMGVHFFHGLVGRFVTDWSGPEGEIRRMEFRSWGRCFPGETAEVVGHVSRTFRDDGEALVDIVAACNCARGRLYDATVTVRLFDPGPGPE